jgi:hypothetical protein
MSDGIDFDFSEILAFAADLGRAPEKAGANVRKAFEVTSRHVKDDWQEPLKGSGSIPRGAHSISYDIETDGTSISADIGPALQDQGAIVGMLEYGTPNTGPRGYGAAALQRNQQDFIDGLEKAIGDVL